MDIVNNNHTLVFNLFALVASLVVLSFALVGIWILLVEFNIYLNNCRQRTADAKIMKTTEELYNDFSS